MAIATLNEVNGDGTVASTASFDIPDTMDDAQHCAETYVDQILSDFWDEDESIPMKTFIIEIEMDQHKYCFKIRPRMEVKIDTLSCTVTDRK